MIRVIKDRSPALLASTPNSAGSAAPIPFVTADSDSPKAVLAFDTTSGVINALKPSTNPPEGCIGIVVSIVTSSSDKFVHPKDPSGSSIFQLGSVCIDAQGNPVVDLPGESLQFHELAKSYY